MPATTFDKLLPVLSQGVPESGPRPGLIFSGDDLASLRRRARDYPEVARRTAEAATTALGAPDFLAVTREV
ncbi:MAG: hypothetical protein HYU36_18370 [Planctomycetes bacterium]|nr:hypothetical protein [Planctomycetota bacterium]